MSLTLIATPAGAVASTPAKAIAVTSPAAGLVELQYGNSVDVRRYGAKGDGVTDDAAAISAAIAAVASGGTVVFPPTGSTYRIASRVTLSKPVILRGLGWSTAMNDYRASTGWNDPSVVTGSVILCDGDGFAAVDDGHGQAIHVELRDLAVLGKGGVGTTGVKLGEATNQVQCRLHHVLVANFGVGVNWHNVIDCESHHLVVKGCTKGVLYDGEVDHNYAFTSDLQCCDIIVQIDGGALVKYFGALMQNATTCAVKVAPTAGKATEGIYFDGVWMENFGTTPIILDGTVGAISTTVFSDCRAGGPYTLAPLGVVNRLAFLDCMFTGDLVCQASMHQLRSHNTNWNSFTPGDMIPVDYTSSTVGPLTTNVGNYIPNATGNVTPAWTSGDIVQITLTGNATIKRPTDAPPNARMTFIIRQDAVGGHTVAWETGWHLTWSDAGNAALKYTAVSFLKIDTTQWIQTTPQTAYTT